MTSVLTVIPARGGSKRLPGKNLKLLAGLTLLEWTAASVSAAGLDPATCLLTTDNEAIAREGRRFGWQVPWLRPPELASDTASTLEAVLHALDWWQAYTGYDPDVTLLLQVTSPFRRGADLQQALVRLETDSNIDGVISANDLHRTAASLFTVAAGRLTPLGTGETGGVLTPNGSFYATRTQTLRRERTFFPARLGVVVMDAVRSLDIDTAADFAVAEVYAQSWVREVRNS